MKQYTVELADDLSMIYEDIAKMSNMPVEEAMQRILKRVIESMLRDAPDPSRQ